MSRFYGYLQGNRGLTHRCGSKGSGIIAHIRSWQNDVYATIEADPETGEDIIRIEIPEKANVLLNGIPLSVAEKETLINQKEKENKNFDDILKTRKIMSGANA